MNIENSIEVNYRKLTDEDDLSNEFEDLYVSIRNEKLRVLFSILHARLVESFNMMNERLPTHSISAHFWADPSRSLIKTIEIIYSLEGSLENSSMAFAIDEYYQKILNHCNDFLSRSGGSAIPANTDKIELYYTIPIFHKKNSVIIENQKNVSNLKIIGEGSYAHVFKYYDKFYKKTFAIKRAKKNINEKEIERFKREYNEMNNLNSPYILDVFSYNEEKREYIMEFMDTSLYKYIVKNNTNLTFQEKKKIGFQIIKAFSYIHSKNILHRDISSQNILIKLYDDVIVIKISDFGLVKVLDSNLTSKNTDFKGSLNDPDLMIEGFDKYNILHETYALTRVLYFVLTGKIKHKKISDNLKEFMEKGLNKTKNNRFKNISELNKFFQEIRAI